MMVVLIFFTFLLFAGCCAIQLTFDANNPYLVRDRQFTLGSNQGSALWQMKSTLIGLLSLGLAARLLTYLLGWLFWLLLHERGLDLWQSFSEVWFKWDSRHHAGIAQYGYRIGQEHEVELAFYPLYPLLIRAVTWVSQWWPWASEGSYWGVDLNYYFSGLVLSNLFFLGSVCILWQLVYDRYGKAMAWRAVKYLVLVPYGFFFGMVYTESLFLFLVLASALAMQRQQWVLSGAIGLFAALTRNQGLLLVVPLGLSMLPFLFTPGLRSWGVWFKALLSLSLVMAGFGLYLLMNWYLTGDAFRFSEFQSNHWGNRFGFFAEIVTKHWHRMLTEQNIRLAVGTWFASLAVLAGCSLILLLSWRRLPMPWVMFLLVYMLVSFSPTWLLSSQRYMISAFPIYVGMAIVASKHPIYESILDLVVVVALIFSLIGFLHWAVY